MAAVVVCGFVAEVLSDFLPADDVVVVVVAAMVAVSFGDVDGGDFAAPFFFVAFFVCLHVAC